VLTASPAVAGDGIAWGACSSHAVGDLVPPTGVTYTLLASDAGTDVCAFEIAAVGDLVDGISDPVGPVGPGPSLSAGGGPVTQGQTITVTQGAWPTGVVPTDTWEDCDASGACAPVASGATGTSYTATRSDVGSTIEVLESAVSGPTTGSITTAPTGIVVATPPQMETRPTVSGTAHVGDTLTVAPGTWSNKPTSYAYQWQRCSGGTCAAIPGQTGATYSPGNADVGDTLEVLVTAAVGRVAGPPYPSYPTNPVVGISTSPPPAASPGPTVVPVKDPRPSTIGRLTATMQWTFRYAPAYTQILALSVDGPALDSRIVTRCAGTGCPFSVHRLRVLELKRCRTHASRRCPPPRTVSLEREFHGHNLGVGARVTVTISRTHDIGKYYRFVVRRSLAPSVRIRCLAPGALFPGKRCI
jgi:hypothetical protein